jgi:hypothetical protein
MFPDYITWADVGFLSFVNSTAVAFQENRLEFFQFESVPAMRRALEELRRRH